MARLLLIRTTEGMSQIFAGRMPRRRRPPFSPPLSLLSLAGVLEEEGHHVSVLDVMCEEDPVGVIHRLLPGIDGVVLCVAPGCHEASRDLVRIVKKEDPSLPVILEGMYCTCHAGEALEVIPADVSIQGDGEDVIGRIVRAMGEKGDLSVLPGVFFRKNGKIMSGAPVVEVMDLDRLPFPARHLVEGYGYGRFNGVQLCRPKFTAVLTSRGCSYQCRFCSSRYVNGGYRQRSVKSVLQEFRGLQGVYRSVVIEDDNFLADRQRALRIMEGLIEAGSELDLFIIGARVGCADRELYSVMARAGVRFISFGIESGSQEILEYYRKGVSVRQIREAVELANEAGIVTWGNFIFGAPVETWEQMKQTMRLSLSLPLDFAFFRPLLYQRGSLLWQEAVAAGMIDEGTSFCIADGAWNGGVFTAEELSRYCQWALLRFYIRPRYLFKEFVRCAHRRDFTVLKSLGSVL